MKILVDTNVVLDIVLNRQEFPSDSKAVFKLAEEKHIVGCISAFAITDIFYFANCLITAIISAPISSASFIV